jgi:hypothetical protein
MSLASQWIQAVIMQQAKDFITRLISEQPRRLEIPVIASILNRQSQ